MNAPPREARPLVAVLVGTDHHRFDRLVRWASELASVGGCRCFVQYGTTPLPGLLPSGVEGAAMLDAADMADLLECADCVVTHGGPGLVMEARAAGHRPVVVPRDPALGEHVDGHQQRFAGVLDRSGLAVRVDSQAEFERAVQAALHAGRAPRSVAATSEVCERFGALADGLARPARPRMSLR